MTIVSMFATLLLTATLGLVMNVGRQLDAKIRMQNAADATAHAGGTLMARSMNAMAFCNHLVPDVMSLVAFFREADAKNGKRSKSEVPKILTTWTQIASQFSSFKPSRVQSLASAIRSRAPLEQQLVDEWMSSVEYTSTLLLPSLEYILTPNDGSNDGLIPAFQQSLYDATQSLVQEAAAEMARQHLGGNAQGYVYGYGGQSPPANIPVIDSKSASFGNIARDYRDSLASRYLNQLNDDFLYYFDYHARMSRFNSIWRGYTCYQMQMLLTEHPVTNLPWVLNSQPVMVRKQYYNATTRMMEYSDTEYIMEHVDVPAQTLDYTTDASSFMEQIFVFAGVVSNPKISEMSPRLFTNPFQTQTQAFAQVLIFVPRPRMAWGGEGGGDLYAPAPSTSNIFVQQRRPMEINAYNQNWQAKLVPATSTSSYSAYLSTSSSGGSGSSLSGYDIQMLTNH